MGGGSAASGRAAGGAGGAVAVRADRCSSAGLAISIVTLVNIL